MKIKREKPAFTLVELLVVISIIALLLAILLPSLAKARAQAQSTVCKARLKEFGVALNLYAIENRGVYVTQDWILPTGSVNSDPNYHWFTRLGKYVSSVRKAGQVGSVDGFFRCPTGMAIKDFGSQPAPYSYHAIDFGLQEYPGEYQPDIRTPAKLIRNAKIAPLTSIIQPAKFAAIFDFYFGEESLKKQYSMGDVLGGGTIQITLWKRVLNLDTNVKNANTPAKVFRHNKSIEVVYADSHVGKKTLKKYEDVVNDQNWWWSHMATPSSDAWQYRPAGISWGLD